MKKPPFLKKLAANFWVPEFRDLIKRLVMSSLYNATKQF